MRHSHSVWVSRYRLITYFYSKHDQSEPLLLCRPIVVDDLPILDCMTFTKQKIKRMDVFGTLRGAVLRDRASFIRDNTLLPAISLTGLFGQPPPSCCLSVSVCLSVCLSLCQSVSLSVLLSVCLCLFLSCKPSLLSLSVCLSLSLSLSLANTLSLSVCLFLSVSLCVHKRRTLYMYERKNCICSKLKVVTSSSRC